MIVLRTRSSGLSRFDRVFEPWMEQVGILLRQFHRFDTDYEPFAETEAAGVSLLLSAAARAQYLPIAEHWVRKRTSNDLRGRYDGRGDLWFVCGPDRYSFEFKRAWNWATFQNLGEVMANAMSDICLVPSGDHEHAFAGVICPVFRDVPPEVYSGFKDYDLAYAVGHGDRPVVHFYFKECRL